MFLLILFVVLNCSFLWVLIFVIGFKILKLENIQKITIQVP